MSFIFYYFLAINILTFIITGLDKRLAVKNQNRISEKKLFSLALAGGIIGSLAAMYIFKHKTSKRSFLLSIFGILIFQILLVILFLFKSE